MKLLMSLGYVIYLQFQEFWYQVRENKVLCEITHSKPWDREIHDKYFQKQIEGILEDNGMERLEIPGHVN